MNQIPEAWSTEEIEVTVVEYFTMLVKELAALPYRKSEHNERARRLLNNRSKSAVEFKFQNISAVLVNHGQVYIKGYLPAQNYQRALEGAVLEWLAGSRDLVDVSERSPVLDPPAPVAASSFSEIVTDPPDVARAARRLMVTKPVKVDFVRLDAENRALGHRGEEFVFEIEQRRLHDEERRPDLAKRVRWCARDEGDGLGYDISSFNRDASKRLIEVKTTGLGKYFPFVVTRNELACSQRERDWYLLYRLYEFGVSPKLYVLTGALDANCSLEPTQYRAIVGTSRA